MGKRVQCTICRHKHRHEIEIALVHRMGVRAIAARFGVGWNAVHRHGQRHMTAVQKAALLVALRPSEIDLEQLRRSEGENLLGALVSQRARLATYSDHSMAIGDAKAAIAAENAIRENLALVARLVGQFATHHTTTTTHLLVSPSYLKLRHVLVTTLRRHPAAARDVSAALAELEREAAGEIIEGQAVLPPPNPDAGSDRPNGKSPAP